MSGNYRCENRLSEYSCLSRMRIPIGINTGGRNLKELWAALSLPQLHGSTSTWESVMCIRGTCSLSKQSLLSIFQAPFSPSIPFPERQDKTHKRTEVLGFTGIHEGQKRGMQKPLVTLTVAGNSHISKTSACRKVTSCTPLTVIVRSHETAKSPHPTCALSSYCGHGPLA